MCQILSKMNMVKNKFILLLVVVVAVKVVVVVVLNQLIAKWEYDGIITIIYI